MAFFSWHAKLEANHARHTWQELEHSYRERTPDEDQFIRHAREMLDGVLVFWRGLDDQRRMLAAGAPYVDVR